MANELSALAQAAGGAVDRLALTPAQCDHPLVYEHLRRALGVERP
jgi:hypothetical protein